MTWFTNHPFETFALVVAIIAAGLTSWHYYKNRRK